MNKQLLDKAWATLQSDTAGALRYMSLISLSSGQSILGYNNTPREDAFLVQAVKNLQKTVQIGEYALADDTQGTTNFFIMLGQYVLLLKVDKDKIMMGMFLNVVLPDSKKNFEEALA